MSSSPDAPAASAANDHGHHSPGYLRDKSAVLARLARIEGQVRGLARMVEADAYCIDVLTQAASVTRSLQSASLVLLEDHLRHCVAGVAADDPDLADSRAQEAMAAITRLVRS